MKAPGSPTMIKFLPLEYSAILTFCRSGNPLKSSTDGRESPAATLTAVLERPKKAVGAKAPVVAAPARKRVAESFIVDSISKNLCGVPTNIEIRDVRQSVGY